MTRTRALAPVLLALAAACRQAPVPEPPAAPALDESRALCLADPGEDPAADRRLRALQAGARKVGERSDPWVLAGKEWVRKARLDGDPGFYLNAAGCAGVALEIEPGSLSALSLRGVVLMNDHRFEEARALAEEVLKDDPEDGIALGTLSDALLELGRYEEAERAAERQTASRPGMAAYARGSYLRWLRGDGPAAKLLIRDALSNRDAREPEAAAWTFVEAATIYWHEADYDGADAVSAEALRWVPDYPAALVGRARVAMARSDGHLACELLEKAYRKRPLAQTAWLLGDAREMSGDAAGARQAYQEVVRQGRRGDRLTLALFYATKDRDVEEALRLVEQELATRGGIYVDDVHAWALYRAGRMAEARAASDRALRLGTRDARLLYHAGAIGIATGEVSSGRELVRAALALNPAFDWSGAREARALLGIGAAEESRAPGRPADLARAAPAGTGAGADR